MATTLPFKEGDAVKMKNEWGQPIGGMRGVVLKCYESAFCSSGYLVLVTFYKRPLDSSWVKKI